jgi:hypothetical protein
MSEKKPAHELTTKEMAERLFPPEVREHVKRIAHEEPKRGGGKAKSSQPESTGV